MKASEKRNLLFVFLVLFVGAVAGTAFSSFVGLTMPDGVVRDFFLIHNSSKYFKKVAYE